MSLRCSANPCCKIVMGEAWACLLLRLWIGMRLFFAGITKWKKGGKEFTAEEMHTKMDSISEHMAVNTPLTREMTDMFAAVLPYALIGVGALVIVGLFTRLSLVLAGVVMLSLAFGLMLLPDDKEAVLRGIELALIAGALVLSRYNIFAVDNLIGMAFSKSSSQDEESTTTTAESKS